jgi:hypothetical protein
VVERVGLEIQRKIRYLILGFHLYLERSSHALFAGSLAFSFAPKLVPTLAEIAPAY